jgi:hypothetical protein
MPAPLLYFIPLASAAAFRDTAEILAWRPLEFDADHGPVAWSCEGAAVQITWQTLPGQPIPLLRLSGADAELLAHEIRQAVPLVDAQDAMNAIAQVDTQEQLTSWAERLALFARGPHDYAVESVISGLLESGKPSFQRAVLFGLQTSEWPPLEQKIAALRRSGVIPAHLTELAVSVETHLSSLNG